MNLAQSQKNIVLLTGVTGFLGKVVLEELLREKEEHSIEKIFVLIRSDKKGVSPPERFQKEVAPSPCFSKLPAGWTEHVEVIPCELTQNDCGLTTSDQSRLSETTHMINCAASVEFHLPLERAASANIISSLNMLELARSLGKLENFVNVSTAYVTPFQKDQGEIHEKLPPLPRPASEIYQEILQGKADEKKLLEETGHPNTYTLTKCLSEHLLTENRGAVPLSIVRPSIVSASWKYPFPGWIDSQAAFAGFVALIGAGYLRSVVAQYDTHLDVVPCDLVADRIITIAFNQIIAKCRDPMGGVERRAPDGAQGKPINYYQEHNDTKPEHQRETCRRQDPLGGTLQGMNIVHATCGLDQSCAIRTCIRIIENFFRRYPVDRYSHLKYVGAKNAHFRIRDWQYHKLPARFLIFINFLRGKTKNNHGIKRLLDQLDYLNDGFPYFTHNSFDFKSSQPIQNPDFDKEAYIQTVCQGTFRHLMGGNEKETILAGKKQKKTRSDWRWAITQPKGNWAIRLSAFFARKALRCSTDSVTFDRSSFDQARSAIPAGHQIVIVPTHRSYMDFVLMSYLFFSRPDLGIEIPHIAAASDFSKIPFLGWFFKKTLAFYIQRGEGKENKEVTEKIHRLVNEGKTIEFFIEGTRSRNRQMLPPRRGLLKCLQSSGKKFSILPVSICYDRIPEERSFLLELRGEAKPAMRLGTFLKWLKRLIQGKINLGRIHITCGKPLTLETTTDINELAQHISSSLASHMAASRFHLRSFLKHNPDNPFTLDELARKIEEGGGKVIESPLTETDTVHPLIEQTFQNHWKHYLESEITRPSQFKREIPMTRKKILVTGATGFVGRHLLFALKEAGDVAPVVLVRNRKIWEGYDWTKELSGVELIEGSIKNLSSWENDPRLEGLSGLFHLAALVKHTRDEPEELYETNVQGTLNMVKLAHRASCRMITVSTSGTVGCFDSPEKTANEHSPYREEEVGSWPYYDSKIRAERQSQELAKKLGVELVIFRPPVLLGPGDHRHRSTSHIVRMLRGRLPFLIRGGMHFVDIRDAVQAMLRAMVLDRPQPIYHLSGTACSIDDFFEMVEKISGMPAPRLHVSAKLAVKLATWAKKTSLLPDPVVFEMASKYWGVHSLYAKEDLGFASRNPYETLQDTIIWLRENHEDLKPKTQIQSEDLKKVA